MAKKRYSYSAYGLNIRSDIALPELVNAQNGDDIDISFRKLADAEIEAALEGSVEFDRPGCRVRVSSSAIGYFWTGIATVLIRKGSEVVISTEPGIGDEDMAPFVTGAILGNLLDQRGFLVLHGSAITVGGKGVAFLGEKGAGKSTFAVHMQKRGYPLLTDDLIPVSFEDGDVRTLPGFPRIRLWNDSVGSVGLDPETLPRANRFVDKRSYQCTDNFSGDRVSIAAIYILTIDDEIAIEDLKPAEAFIELTRNTYLNRYLGATGRDQNHFRACEAVVRSVPMFRLRRPHDFRLLPEVSSTVIRHAEITI